MTFVALALIAAGYELAAIASRGRWPTITALVRRLPVAWRLGLVAVLAALLADHFTTGYMP